MTRVRLRLRPLEGQGVSFSTLPGRPRPPNQGRLLDPARRSRFAPTNERSAAGSGWLERRKARICSRSASSTTRRRYSAPVRVAQVDCRQEGFEKPDWCSHHGDLGGYAQASPLRFLGQGETRSPVFSTFSGHTGPHCPSGMRGIAPWRRRQGRNPVQPGTWGSPPTDRASEAPVSRRLPETQTSWPNSNTRLFSISP
jgi:hypothetical protein